MQSERKRPAMEDPAVAFRDAKRLQTSPGSRRSGYSASDLNGYTASVSNGAAGASAGALKLTEDDLLDALNATPVEARSPTTSLGTRESDSKETTGPIGRSTERHVPDVSSERAGSASRQSSSAMDTEMDDVAVEEQDADNGGEVVSVSEDSDDVHRNLVHGQSPLKVLKLRVRSERLRLLDASSADTSPTASAPPSSRHHNDNMVLSTTGDGRPYTTFADENGNAIPGCGGMYPTGYKLHDDPLLPFICPIRSCQKIFKTIVALGAHHTAGHKRKKLNDNLDGTFTIVGELSNVVKPFCHVVSRNSSLAKEPLAEPMQPHMALNRNNRGQSDTRPAISTSSSNVPTFDEPPAPRELRKTSRNPIGSHAGDGTPAYSLLKNNALATYIRQFLPANYELPERGYTHDLLQLPRVRHLPQSWISAYSGKPIFPACLAAVLMYLTGEPPQGGGWCAPCKSAKGALPFDRCIVISPSAAGAVTFTCKGTCASCWFLHTIDKQKNGCSFVAREGAGSAAAAAPAKRTEDSSARSASAGTRQAERFLDDDDEDELSRRDRAPNGQSPSPGRRRSWYERSSRSRADAIYSRASDRHPRGDLVWTGQVVPMEVLDMEDWEVAPGHIKDKASREPDNVAFSNSYLTANQSVPIADNISFQVVILKPGHSHRWEAMAGRVRACSLASGKLRVKVGDQSFIIGPNGVFKIREGVEARVENRLYVDATLHVSTIDVV